MRTATILADFSKQLKEKIKPLHGVNNSPLSLYKPPLGFYEAGIPFCRLHDTGGMFGGAHFVDIPNIFPDFNADPKKPESYDFTFTDAYLTQLHAAGTEIFYRLGVTIENNYRIKGYRNRPPENFEKWAEICAGVVRHYNYGWANGFKFGIRYWEIWNEPENPPMWSGTEEQFFELYRITSKRLKKEFPEIKVGGYASCGFRALTRPNPSDFYKSFLSWFDDFLKFVTNRKTRCPLDFFSWHHYTLNPEDIPIHAKYVDSKLKSAGLKNVESIFDEWNYVGRGYMAMKKAEGACFVASAFCLMQGAPVNKAMYYDADPQRSYCGLYHYPDVRTSQTYSVFFMWNRLYRLGNRRMAQTDAQKLYVCAAASHLDKAMMIANFSTESCRISLNLVGAELENFNGWIIDRRHDNSPFSLTKEIVLPPFAVLLLTTENNLSGNTFGEKDTSEAAGLNDSRQRKKN